MPNIAIPCSSPELFLIKDDQIIGHATLAFGYGLDFVGVRLSEDTFRKLFHADTIEGLGARDMFVRFSPVSGGFLEAPCAEMAEALQDVSAVNCHNLKYGWVPSHFAKVPGYASVFLEEAAV